LDHLGAPLASFRVVICNLGAGTSLAAVLGGCSVDATIGFNPLEGLVMATRSGTIDPRGAVAAGTRRTVRPRDHRCSREQLRAVRAGRHGDMRYGEAAAERGGPGRAVALDTYTHRLAAGVAAMTAVAGGTDAMKFTGGVGERSPTVRRRTADGLSYMGIAIESGVDKTGGVTSAHPAREFAPW
jgi:acetate kinase